MLVFASTNDRVIQWCGYSLDLHSAEVDFY
jgi:hypothetical protein